MSLNKVCAGAAIAVFMYTSAAVADEGPSREECVAASEGADPLRKAGKLLAARQKLRVCIAKECPNVIREDCTEQLVALQAALPSIVFSAKGPADQDLAAVRVTMDGAPLLPRLDGSAVSIDPGEHAFVFETEGYPAVERTLVVAEGVRGRSETIAFGKREAGAATARLVVATKPGATVRLDGKVVSSGTFDGHVTPGAHDVRVTQPGMNPASETVALKDGEMRTLEITLEPEKSRSSALPWVIIGGSVLLAAGGAIGAYFLFRPEDKQGPPLTGKAGGVSLAVFQ